MESFEDVIGARLPALLRYAAVLTGDRDLAQDVVQDAMIRAHARWTRISRMDRPDLYLRRMILTEHLSLRRRRARRAALDQARRPVEEHRPDHADGHAERDDLWTRLATLPPRHRAVLVLRYYEDLSDGEIAEVLDCAIASVRVYRARALATLRLDRELEETR
ncbi:SigE family RNA polymerase sigma factor [Micromonospora auratinigra]|uniref:RNA polymerase sigma-70 factor, sigma-E family n=1 Tax=Micromonospora auratinigra TaxID=261654 RepID=A0A1A9A620_9ACTN|nr:SigE family RNA polymerase sigma factor [Micromonospora auratinigra]SBT51622.1 RNA polymerase sigma-70 factor, sigma-E family [Micromonospora auratinigra]